MKVISNILHTVVLSTLWLLVYMPINNYASNPVKPDSVTRIVDTRNFQESNLEYYRSIKDYAYYKGVNYEANFFQRLWRTFKEKFQKALGITSASRINEILFYALIIISIIGIMYHLLRSQSSGIWHRKNVAIGDEDVVLLSEGVDIDMFENYIRKSVADSDFRLAIRYHFAHTLKAMDNAGMITWKPELTNLELHRMITSEDLKRDFKELATIFEHTWYGNYEITEHVHYDRYSQKFNDFLNKIRISHA